MPEIFKKIQNVLDRIDSYYALALTLYAAALYVLGNTYLFFWIFVAATPVLTGWGGYLLKSYVEQQSQRYGFKVVSNIMSYEINPNHKYVLRYTTKVQSQANHLMVYPICYQWTGSGEEGVPKVTGKGQQLLTLAKRGRGALSAKPYEASAVSTEDDWHYWFIALNPPVHKGGHVEIKYSQEFHDKKGVAKPYLYYFVRTRMKRLELNVRFPANSKIKTITGSYIKPSDSNRPYPTPGVVYNEDDQWANWVIDKPKKGYCYRINWQ
jgi:hypothetical protein